MISERCEVFGAQLDHCPQVIVVPTKNFKTCSHRKDSGKSNQICCFFCLSLHCQLAMTSTGYITRRHSLPLHRPHHRLRRLRRLRPHRRRRRRRLRRRHLP
jgi:hypothetical protein